MIRRIVAVLAFVIGAMAVFAGGQVLLRQDPGYYVIGWLPVYNYTAGILTVFISSPLLWTNSRLGTPVAIAAFSLHAVVMLILQTAYRDVVASESTVAMVVRLTVWAVILALLYVNGRQTRSA